MYFCFLMSSGSGSLWNVWSTDMVIHKVQIRTFFSCIRLFWSLLASMDNIVFGCSRIFELELLAWFSKLWFCACSWVYSSFTILVRNLNGILMNICIYAKENRTIYKFQDWTMIVITVCSLSKYIYTYTCANFITLSTISSRKVFLVYPLCSFDTAV